MVKVVLLCGIEELHSRVPFSTWPIKSLQVVRVCSDVATRPILWFKSGGWCAL